MVIVVIGDMETGAVSVGRLLAESLGWEFALVGSLDAPARLKEPFSDGPPIAQIETLSKAIDCSMREWRDLVISCLNLTEKDGRLLRQKHPAAKFVHLRQAEKTNHALISDPCTVTGSGLAAKWSTAAESDGSVLSVDPSEGAERILGVVLSTLILRQRQCKVSVA